MEHTRKNYFYLVASKGGIIGIPTASHGNARVLPVLNFKINNNVVPVAIYILRNGDFIIIIISLLMSPLLRHRPYGLHIRRTGHNPPRLLSAGWWVLTIANAAGTNGLTCLPEHGGAQDNKFLVTHPITDQRCLTSAIAR
jgi:hypothetical protein